MSPAVVTEQRPNELVWSLTNGVVHSKCLHAVAELDLADYIGDRAVSAEELAERCGVHAGALDRVMRLLGEHGVFHPADGGFRHTPASELLRTDIRGRCARTRG